VQCTITVNCLSLNKCVSIGFGLYAYKAEKAKQEESQFIVYLASWLSWEQWPCSPHKRYERRDQTGGPRRGRAGEGNLK